MGDIGQASGYSHKPMVTLRHVPVAATIGYEIHEFLAQEALLLDHQEYADWGTLLARDLQYRCPSRLFDASIGTDFESTEDSVREHGYDFLVRHIRNINSPSQRSPVQTVRRLITNVIIGAGSSAREFAVTSYVLVAGATGTSAGSPLLTVERRDILRRCAQTYQIVRRAAGLSTTNMDTLRAARIV